MIFGPKKPDFDLSSELEFEEYSPLLRILKPRLRPDAKEIPQNFGGKTYYVLQDPITLQFYRVAETEHEILGRLDGKTTLGEIHDALIAELGGEAPSFRDLGHFVFMLRHSNLLVPEPGEQTRWSVERTSKKRKDILKQKFSNFMYLTIPLLDPDRFLVATLPYVRWLFSPAFFVVWLLTLGAAVVTFLYHHAELTAPANQVLAKENLLYLWLAFLVIKTFHEFGHAFASRRYGAEVHRMGVMFLIFMPCWYVDTTPIWAFPKKWPKMVVGLAGMMTELFLASLALFAWLALDPGVLRTVLYNVIFVASVSTVLFNGNPLLRYDAYYVLADLLEIPNLRQHSTQYLTDLVKKYLIGEKVRAESWPLRERVWFFIYGPLAAAYRLLIVGGILLYIASKLYFVGLIMAAVVAALWLVTPLVKLVKYIFFDKETKPVRARAAAVFGLGAIALFVLVGIVPMDTTVRTPCVVEPHEQRELHAEWPGFLSEVYVKDGEQVRKGQMLAIVRNDELDSTIRRQEAEVEGAEAQLRMLETQDLAKAHAEAEQLLAMRKDLDMLLDRQKSLTFRAPFDGQVIAPNLARVKGRFLQLGDPLFTVASLDRLDVTAVVDTADDPAIQKVQSQDVEIQFGSDASHFYHGKIAVLYPYATNTPPPVSLTNAGGGTVLLDPASPEGKHTLLPWFKATIELDAGKAQPPVGATGAVRFIVGRDPLGMQMWLKFRRMLARRFLI